jgi:hypothetical protein
VYREETGKALERRLRGGFAEHFRPISAGPAAPCLNGLTQLLAMSRLKLYGSESHARSKGVYPPSYRERRLRREEEAVREALSLWEERERKRAEFLATIEDAKASTARGEGRVITQQSMQELAEEVKQRGRSRLTAEQQASR